MFGNHARAVTILQNPLDGHRSAGSLSWSWIDPMMIRWPLTADPERNWQGLQGSHDLFSTCPLFTHPSEKLSPVSIKCPFWQLRQIIDNHGQIIAMNLGNHLLNRVERTCGGDHHSPFWVKVHLSSVQNLYDMVAYIHLCPLYPDCTPLKHAMNSANHHQLSIMYHRSSQLWWSLMIKSPFETHLFHGRITKNT